MRRFLLSIVLFFSLGIIANSQTVHPDCATAAADSPTAITIGTSFNIQTTGATAAGEMYSSEDASLSLASFSYIHISIPATGTYEIVLTDPASGTPVAGNLSMGIHTACDVTSNHEVFSGSYSSGTTYNCNYLATGDYILVFATENATVYDVDIVFNTQMGMPANDRCDAPMSISNPTDCTWAGVSSNSLAACPEMFGTQAGCDFSTGAYVWHSYAVPANATHLDIRNLMSSVGTPRVLVVNQPTDCASVTPVGNCITMAGMNGLGSANYIPVTGGTTYYFVVGTDDAAGSNVTFDLRAIIPPANDACSSATSISNASLPITENGTTNCAVEMGDNMATCAPTGSTAVYYTFQVPNPTTTKTLRITVARTTGTTGTGDMHVAAFDGCSSTPYGGGPAVLENCGGPAVLDIDCPTPGSTITIAVSTTATEQGDFDITISEESSINVTNDNCTSPIAISDPMDCSWSAVSSNSVTACPETFGTQAGCDFNTGAYVWHSYAVPANATHLDIRNLMSSAGTPRVLVVEQPSDCTTVTPVGTCVTSADINGLGTANLIPVTGGTTYYFIIGTDDAAGADVTFDLRAVISPLNDACEDAIAMDNTSLPSTMSGTTNCAVETGDNLASCVPSSPTVSTGVYYTFQVPNPTTTKTLRITVARTTGTGDMHVAAFDGCSSTPYGGGAVQENCGGPAVLDIDCPTPGSTITIAVSTTATEQGDFSITLSEEATIAVSNDNCTDPIAITDPTDCSWSAVASNSVTACPETFGTQAGCDFSTGAYVWHSYAVPANATHLDIRNLTSSAGTPRVLVVNQPTDCASVTPVGNCITMAGADGLGSANYIPVTGGTTYYFVVGTDDVAGSNVTFDLRAIIPPANDECTNAAPLTVGTALTDQTTVCATGPLTGLACDSDKIQTVWYTYTTTATDKTLTIDVTNFTNTSNTDQLSIAVFEDCTSGMLVPQADGNGADYCGSANMGNAELTLSCLPDGTTLYIMVSTSAENEGTFDITLNSEMINPNCVDNDVCANVDQTSYGTPIVTNDANPTCVMDCNTGACPDDEINTLCGSTVSNTVFYEFTTDGFDPTIETFVSASVTGLTSPVLMILKGSCGSYQLLDGSACYTGTTGVQNDGWVDGNGNGLQPNTTYTLVVGTTDGMGGDFNLCVQVSQGCVNDTPCQSVIVPDFATGGGTQNVSNPATTNNCNQDFMNCDPDSKSSAWYKVKIPEDVNRLEITVNNVNISGNISMVVFRTTDCNDVQNNLVQEECAVSGTVVVECVQKDEEYFIQVGTDEANEGDFTIDFTTSKVGPVNDMCTDVNNAIFPVSMNNCMYISLAGTLVDACPWSVMSGSCNYSENATVFYRVDIPAAGGDGNTVTGIDVRLTGLANPMFAVLSSLDCATPSNSQVAAGGDEMNNGCVTDGEANNIPVVPGNTYYIAVSSSANEKIPFTLEVKLITPPDNDNPCNTGVNASKPVSGTYSGNTCCARGTEDVKSPTDNSPADPDAQDCTTASQNEAVVWHNYDPGAMTDSNEGFDVSFAGTSDMSVEVYWGQPDAGCNGGAMTKIATNCGGMLDAVKIGNCPPNAGDIIHIRVGSSKGNCGDYTITIDSGKECLTNDECASALEAAVTTITDCNNVNEGKTLEGCLHYACSNSDAPAGCSEHGNSPTVWYKYTLTNDAFVVSAGVTNDGSWDPRISLYQGDDCGNLTPLGCSSDEGSPTLVASGLNIPNPVPADGYTVYVAVTGDGIDPTDDLNFNIEFISSIECIDCVDDDVGACLTDALTLTVNSRSSDRPLDDTEFCPGEEVELCINFTYDPSQSNADWLQAMIPRFGPGWDMDGYDYNSANITANFSGTPEWREADGGPCAPTARLNFPLIRTYIDDDGKMQFCHSGCEACPGGGSAVVANDPIPSGWFYITPTSACATSCSPRDNWGLNQGFGETSVQICLTLKVKQDFGNETCEENKKLNIDIWPASDALTGCWTGSLPCIRDDVLLGPAGWMIDCVELPEVMATGDMEYCSGETTNINLSTDASATIQVYIKDENGIVRSGGNPLVDIDPLRTDIPDYNFDINEMVENNTGSARTLTYYFQSKVAGVDCPSPLDSFVITVHPKVELQPQTYDVCAGKCIDISANVISGTAPYTYSWDNGDTGQTINVCPTTTTTYTVTVTDANGCMGMGDYTVSVGPLPQVDIYDDSTPPNIITEYNICAGMASNSYIQVIDQTGDYASATWEVVDGIAGLDLDVNPADPYKCGFVEETSLSGTYEVKVTVTDIRGCEAEGMVTINVSGGLNLQSSPTVNCGDTNINIQVCDQNGEFAQYWRLYTCNGSGNYDAIVSGQDHSSNSDCFTFQNVDITSNTCFIAVASKDEPINTNPGSEPCGQDSILIMINPPTGVDIQHSGDAAICAGTSHTAQVINELSFTTIAWVNNTTGATDSNTGTLMVTPMTTGATTYTINATDASGCMDTKTVTITVNPNPLLTLNDFDYCDGGTYTINGPGAPAGSTYTYIWKDISDPASNLGTMKDLTLTDNTGTTLPSQISLTITDQNGCNVSDTMRLNETTVTELPKEEIILCETIDTLLQVAGTGYSNFVWTKQGDSTPLVPESNPANYRATSSGIYIANFDTPNCKGKKEFEITQVMPPTVSVTSSLEVCNEDNGMGAFTVDFISQVQSGSSAGVWSIVAPAPTVTGGSFDFTDKSNVSFENVPAGTYQFEYTSNTATAPCMDVSAILTVTVKTCGCPTITLNPAGPLCNTAGIVTLTKDATTPSGDWTVTSGPSGQALTGIISGDQFNKEGLKAGSYEVTFTLNPDPGGTCTKSDKITIVVSEAPTAAVKQASYSVCNKTGGDPWEIQLDNVLTAATTGGGTWSTSETGITLGAGNLVSGDGVALGDYVFTYTTTADAPCTPVTVDVTIRVRNCACPDVAVDPLELCTGNAAQDLSPLLTNTSGITGTWSIKNSAGADVAGAIAGTMIDPSQLDAGTYRLIYTLGSEPNPGNGCAIAYENTLKVEKQPEAVFKPGANPCNVDTDPSDGNNPTMINLYDYLEPGYTAGGKWELKSGDAITIAPDGSVDFNGVDLGKKYEFTYTVKANMPCSDVEVTVALEVVDCDCPPISLTAPNALCNDMGMIDLSTLSTGSDPGSFEVRNAGGVVMPLVNQKTFDASGVDAGTYTIKYTLNATVPSGCTQDATVTLEVSEYRDVTVKDASVNACNVSGSPNGSNIVDLTIMLDNPMNGTWKDDDGAGVTLSDPKNVDFVGKPVGTYRFTYTIDNAEPCGDPSVTVEVVVDDCTCPIVNLVNPAPVCKSSAEVDLFMNNDPSRPGTWSTTSSELSIRDGRYLDLSNATQTTYNLTYTINDLPTGCTPETVQITILEQLTAGTGRNVKFCFGETEVVDLKLLLENSPSSGGVWTNTSVGSGGTFDAGAATFDITGADAGTYTFTYAFENQTPCNDVSSTIEVIIHENPNADAGADKVIDCDNPEAQLGGTSTPAGALSFYWKKLQSTSTIANNDGPTVTVEDEGDYELKVTHQTTTCTDLDTVNVRKDGDIPRIDTSVTQPLCFGDVGGIVLSNPSGGSGTYSYTLNGEKIEELDIKNLAAGSYTIIMKDEDTGCEKPYNFDIDAIGEFTLDIPEGIVYGVFNQEFTFTADFKNLEPGTIITWTDDKGNEICKGSAEDCKTITVEATQNTVYTVTAVNPNGCPATDMVEVRLEEDVSIEFPNVIRPGSTVGNKSFYVIGKFAKTVKNMYIYDRWGELVFSVSDVPANDPKHGWTGNFNRSEAEVKNDSGKEVQPGVYTFLVELEMVDSQGNPKGDEVHTGSITIVR